MLTDIWVNVLFATLLVKDVLELEMTNVLDVG